MRVVRRLNTRHHRRLDYEGWPIIAVSARRGPRLGGSCFIDRSGIETGPNREGSTHWVAGGAHRRDRQGGAGGGFEGTIVARTWGGRARTASKRPSSRRPVRLRQACRRLSVTVHRRSRSRAFVTTGTSSRCGEPHGGRWGTPSFSRSETATLPGSRKFLPRRSPTAPVHSNVRAPLICAQLSCSFRSMLFAGSSHRCPRLLPSCSLLRPGRQATRPNSGTSTARADRTGPRRRASASARSMRSSTNEHKS